MNSNDACDLAVGKIVTAVRDALRCRTSERGVSSIRMPLLYADGDSIEVHIAPSFKSSTVVISDLGLAISRLESQGMRPRQERLMRLLGGLGIKIDSNQQLYIQTTIDDLGVACLRLAQGISNLSAVAYMRRATTVDEFVQEFTAFLRSRDIAAQPGVRRTVSIETRHGVSVQSPRIDFQLEDRLLLMTVPANATARARKIEHCYLAWNVLDRANDALPRLTVVDSEVPMATEDANLLADYSAVIAFEHLEKQRLNLNALESMAASRTVAIHP